MTIATRNERVMVTQMRRVEIVICDTCGREDTWGNVRDWIRLQRFGDPSEIGVEGARLGDYCAPPCAFEKLRLMTSAYIEENRGQREAAQSTEANMPYGDDPNSKPPEEEKPSGENGEGTNAGNGDDTSSDDKGDSASE